MLAGQEARGAKSKPRLGHYHMLFYPRAGLTFYLLIDHQHPAIALKSIDRQIHCIAESSSVAQSYL